MTKDTRFLLHPSFEDPAFPDKVFYCEDCALIEGVLATFPTLNTKLNIQRIGYARPRKEVIEIVGPDNQWLPCLILKEGETSPHQTGSSQGRSFISDKAGILQALAERHGIALPHP
jgi:hypothetical protein